MKLHTQSFFYTKKEGPTCHVTISKIKEFFPVTIAINSDIADRYSTPHINFFLESREALVAFKNSVLSAYDKAMRGDEDDE